MIARYRNFNAPTICKTTVSESLHEGVWAFCEDLNRASTVQWESHYVTHHRIQSLCILSSRSLTSLTFCGVNSCRRSVIIASTWRQRTQGPLDDITKIEVTPANSEENLKNGQLSQTSALLFFFLLSLLALALALSLDDITKIEVTQENTGEDIKNWILCQTFASFSLSLTFLCIALTKFSCTQTTDKQTLEKSFSLPVHVSDNR